MPTVMPAPHERRVPQGFLRQIFEWNNDQVFFSYRLFVRAWQLYQRDGEGRTSGEMLAVLGDVSTHFLSQIREYQRKLRVLEDELVRCNWQIESGNLTVRRGSALAERPRVISGSDDFSLPEHLVVMLKNKDHELVFASDNYEAVFKTSFRSTENSGADELFHSSEGQAILAAESEIARTSRPSLFSEDILVADNIVLHRMTICFEFGQTQQIGIVCWDAEKGLPENSLTVRGSTRQVARTDQTPLLSPNEVEKTQF
jgi:hypothetical protein